MAQILCEKLTVGYEGKAILKDLDFAVEKGQYLCIAGENGAGKSTLMKTLVRLQAPIEGKILLLEGVTADEIGYLPQQTHVQRDFPASVREIVLSGCQNQCRFRPFYSRTEKNMAENAMKKMGIEHLAERCYRELSGGQQQRVLLARALCAAKQVLFLDEPTAGLDPKVTAELYELVAELNRKDGLTVVMISHDIETAVNYASHILHIGKQTFFGTTEEYRNSPFWKTFANMSGGRLS